MGHRKLIKIMQKYFGYTYTKKRGCIIHVCRWTSSIFTRFYLGQDFQIPSQEKEALHQTHKLKRDSFYAVIMGKVNIVNPITYKTFPEICDDLQKCTIFWWQQDKCMTFPLKYITFRSNILLVFNI